jgi:site-specific DNA-methyltransferase (adenine-specific)
MKRRNDANADMQFMVSQQYNPDGGFGDSGSAARFFYCAKASKKDRDEGCDHLPEHARNCSFRVANALTERGSSGRNAVRGRMADDATHGPKARNNHPTVKPTALMRYLCRLVTPPEGIVLDPFMGSGSTGKAALLEGFQFVGIERDPEYFKIATKPDSSCFSPASEKMAKGGLTLVVLVW